MKKSKLRMMLLVLVILVAGAVVGIELRENLEDVSVELGIGNLDSFWASRRKTAAKMLGQFSGDTDKVVPALAKALGDRDAGVRLAALESLEAFGQKSKPAGPVVRDLLLRDPEMKVRRQAATVLRTIKDKDAAAALVKSLDDGDPAVRAEATRSLGALGPGVGSGPIIDTLLSALSGKSPVDVREAGIETLNVLAPDQERVARAIANAASHDESAQVRKRAVDTIKRPKFDFQVPALITALGDPDAQVRLSAVNKLAWVGFSDDRAVPALCRAALAADHSTREGIGLSLDLIVFDKRVDQIPDEVLTRRMQNAVREFQRVMETPNAGAREHVIDLLGRVIGYYQRTRRPALLAPARAAVQIALARLDDEREDVFVRIHALDHWFLIQQGRASPAQADGSGSTAPAHGDELHARALWIAAMCGALKSAVPEVRDRAGEILMIGFQQPVTDPLLQETWRKAVPALALAAGSGDSKLSHNVLAILSQFGPEAGLALPALRSLASSTHDAQRRSDVEGAITSIAAIDDIKAKDPATRIAAAEMLGRLRWHATPALPALIATLEDPEIKVRAAAASALETLGMVSATAVPAIATALAGEADAGVRVALVQALEAIAPGTPSVVAAHLKALRDPDPAVRVAGARFQKAAADESLVAALALALGDPSEDVRVEAASSLSVVLFESPAVAPTLFKAMHEETQRKAALQGLANLLEKTPTPADLGHVRLATLSALIPAMKETLAVKDEDIRLIVYRVLGRIASFSRVSRDAKLRAAVEPALTLYLAGLDESDAAIRDEVLGHVGSIPIHRSETGLSLNKFLERPDRTEHERSQAQLALKELATPPGPRAGPARGGLRRFGGQ